MVKDNKGKITYIQNQKEDLAIFRITPEGGVPDYKAGQFLTLGMPVEAEGGKMIRRGYSIASHPENKKYFEFVIRWVRKPYPGRLTTELFDAKVGDDVSWIRPTGHMTINDELPNGEPDRRRIVCIGGGTLSYKELLTNLENESLDRGADKWNFKYRAAISRPQEWFNRSWTGQVGRVEQFLRAKPGEQSPLEDLVGEKLTKDNTMFYICGWQGTIDGTMDYLQGRDFVTQRHPREDGSYEVKYESYG